MSQKNFLDKRGLTYFYDKINSSYLIKYQNMSTNKTDLAVIATKYDSTSTYDIGDYCVYQEKLYKCSINIETAEAWNEQHWIEVTISDELENIYNLFEDVLLKPQVSGTQGQVLTADGQGGQSWEDSIASGIAASDANEDGNIIINNTINVELDERPTEDSVNGVTSGGVYDELEDIRNNLSQKYEKPFGGIPASDLATGIIPDVPVTDVQINGSSVLNNGLANIPMAEANTTAGVVRTYADYGISIFNDGRLVVNKATDEQIKNGTNQYKPIVPLTQSGAAFYGLAQAAGDSTQSQSSNPVGTYTDEAKSAIKTMLDITDGGIEVSDPNDDGILVFEELGNLSNTGIIADTYSNIATYDVGDYCIYEKRLYKCISEISTAEEWDSSHWIIVNVGDELKDNYVKNTDYATSEKAGIIKVSSTFGVQTQSGTYADYLRTYPASPENIKTANSSNDCLYRPITPIRQHQSVFYGLAKAAGDFTQSTSNNIVGNYTDEAKTAIRTMLGAIGDSDYASNSKAGIVGIDDPTNGIGISGANNLIIRKASSTFIKNGTNNYSPIVPANQHESVFYGLAKVAGDITQSSSSNAVGTYTDEAKSAIKTMLGIDMSSLAPFVEEVSGTTPVITAEANVRYVCGEVSTIDITPPSVGTCDITFISGSTPTVLTIPSTILMPEWFDSSTLEADTLYEIMITDSSHGMVMSWAM